MDSEKHVISLLVDNRTGVLSRVVGLFGRRGFNIDSLAVGVTENAAISRMTIVVNGDEYIVEQVEKQLNKLIDVIKVRKLNEDELISRELMLIKVGASSAQRGEVVDIAKIMAAKIVDISKSTLTVEICDTPERVDLLEELLKPYKIKEVIRTGTVAIQSGSSSI